MLILSRYRDESVVIEITPEIMQEFIDRGESITIVSTVVDIRGEKVRQGWDAPAVIPIHRQEVYEAIKRKRRLGNNQTATCVGAVENILEIARLEGVETEGRPIGDIARETTLKLLRITAPEEVKINRGELIEIEIEVQK